MQHIVETAVPISNNAQLEEIERLRKLVIKLMAEKNKDESSGQNARFVNSETSLAKAYQEAAEELVRKQKYLQEAVDTITALRAEIDAGGQGSVFVPTMSSTEVQDLKTSLAEAWAELERKQGYLEDAIGQINSLSHALAEAHKEIEMLKSRLV